MSENFKAHIVAELDTSKIPSQIKSKIESQKIVFNNFTLDTKGLGTKIQKALDGHKFTLNLTNVKVDTLNKTIEGQMRSAGSRAGAAFSKSLLEKINTQINTGGIEASVDKVRQKFEQLSRTVNNLGNGGKKTELQGQLQQVESEFRKLESLQAELEKGGLTGNALVTKYKEFNNSLLTVRNTLTSVSSKSKEFASSMEVAALQNKMQTWLMENTKAAGQYGAKIQELITKLKELRNSGNVSTSDFRTISNEFAQIDMSAGAAGLKGKSFFDTFSNGFHRLTRYVSAATIIYSTFNAIRSGVSAVTALDTALIDLRKTTDATATQLKEFYYSANDTAKTLGVTTKDVIQAAAEWSRLGYSIRDAQTMSEVSSIFATISPGMDIDMATNGLISAMKANINALLYSNVQLAYI